MAINTADELGQENLSSTDSEGSLSFLDGTSVLDSLICPWMSTRSEGGGGGEYHGPVDIFTTNLFYTIFSPDSGSVTPPDFSVLTCSGLSSARRNQMCSLLNHSQQTWRKVVVSNQR